MEPNDLSDSNQLRAKAEEILKNRMPKMSSIPSESELLRLMQEFEVYQIELELQNEELILAREKAEKIASKYTSLYDFAPIGYFTLSVEGKILDLNLVGAKMLGFQRSVLKKKLFRKFIPENGQNSFNHFLEKAFKSKTKEIIEIYMLGPGNTPVCAQLTAIVEEDHNDHCLLTVLDITDRKKAQSELEAAAKGLKKLNAQKDMFFSIIAHDLKNPFNAIIGYSELLMMEVKKKDYPVVEEFAEIILESSVKAMDLLRNLMEWAKSQTGRIFYNPTKIKLIDVVKEVKDMFDQIAQQKEIKIIADISNETEILADKNMMASVVRNLVSNAVKFANQGGEINIFTKEDSKFTTLCVRDYGVGIAQQDLEKLFSIETNFTLPGTNDEQGTGLGLILCKEFVEKHGGKIWAESEENEGSTFYVSLPK